MRNTLLSTLVAGTLAVAGSASAAPLLFDFDGVGGTGAVSVSAFDWAPTSFLAIGGNAAIAAYLADALANNGVAQGTYTFDVLTHAKMTAYKADGAASFTGINRADEITLVSRFTETITGVGVLGGQAIATFAATGAGWLEMYYGMPKNSDDLTGSGFDDGRLIMRATGVDSSSTGNFAVSTTIPAVSLDQTGANDYIDGVAGDQQTVTGSGSQTNMTIGFTSMDIDTTFFKTTLADFSLSFANIGQALPFISVDPSDCFTPNATANAVGTDNATVQCLNNHVQGPYALQGNDGGLAPITGPVNGFLGAASQGAFDFVAQADFNSPVSGAVPEPATLALLGLGLVGLGFSTRRRRG
jgi:hypothetical protein